MKTAPPWEPKPPERVHSVQVSMPIHCNVNPETMISMAQMVFHVGTQPPPTLARYDLRYWRSSMLPAGRHGLLVEALKAGGTHILWIDGDMVFPCDTLHRLLAHDLPVVGANCVMRMDPYKWTAQTEDHEEVSSTGRTGVEKVGRLGFGVTLMKLDVFLKIDPPFFQFEWIEDDPKTKEGHFQGEDFYLFEKLSNVGIHPHIDHDLSQEIKHVGDIAVDVTFANAWRAGSEVMEAKE